MIGAFAALLSSLTMKLMENTPSLDDPVGSVAVHYVSGIWGLLATGIFARADERIEIAKYDGLLRGILKCLNSAKNCLTR